MSKNLPFDLEIAAGQINYPDALAAMDDRVTAIAAGEAREKLWLLEHPDIYTAGTSADAADLLDPRFPVYKTGRGGEYTYHGPGQRVGYAMLDLKRRQPDLRRYIYNLEEWIIRTLARFNIEGGRREGRIGIWVQNGLKDEKIAAIGVRVRKWVTFHGIALNIDPDLGKFGGIVPCGIREHGVTSIYALGHTPSFEDVDAALTAEFERIFY